MTANFADRLGGYVEVKDRIAAFKAEHPEGSLQAEIYLLNDDVVVMKAYAYRTPDDVRPGVGWSSLQIPGSTPYTRGSEIENCETSAWGRAIAALGFKVSESVATGDEIRGKRDQANTEMRRFATDRPVAGLSRGSAARGGNRPETPSNEPQGTLRTLGDLLTRALRTYEMDKAAVCVVLDVADATDIVDYEAAWQKIEAYAKQETPA